MRKYNVHYRNFLESKKFVHALTMVRAKFYMIREYITIDEENQKYADIDAPIIFTLYVSKKKDIVHAVKISNVNPIRIRRFFGRFVSKIDKEIELKGDARNIYNKIVKRVKIVKEQAYRTYKLSGLKKVLELEIDTSKITPKNKQPVGIDKASQVKNK